MQDKVNRVLERLLVDEIKEECIDYVNEEVVNSIVLFLETGERRKSKLVECLGMGYTPKEALRDAERKWDLGSDTEEEKKENPFTEVIEQLKG